MFASQEWVLDLFKKAFHKAQKDKYFAASQMESAVICTKAMISSTSAYIKTNFVTNPFNNYEYLCAYVTVPSVSGNTAYKTMANIVALGSRTMTVYAPTTSNISFEVGSNYVRGTSYSGAWREIYVTLVAYRTPAYGAMMQEYNTHTE